jgi:hypothetical protein
LERPGERLKLWQTREKIGEASQEPYVPSGTKGVKAKLSLARMKQSEPYLKTGALVQYKRHIQLHKWTRSGAKKG